MIGECGGAAIPSVVGGKTIGDDLYEEIFHPVAGRLLQLC